MTFKWLLSGFLQAHHGGKGVGEQGIRHQEALGRREPCRETLAIKGASQGVHLLRRGRHSKAFMVGEVGVSPPESLEKHKNDQKPREILEKFVKIQ